MPHTVTMAKHGDVRANFQRDCVTMTITVGGHDIDVHLGSEAVFAILVKFNEILAHRENRESLQ